MPKTWQPGQPVNLETERFILRSVRPWWLAFQTRPWTDDPDIMIPLNHKAGGWSLWQWRRTMVHANNRRKFLIGIFAKDTGQLIGYETLHIDRNSIASFSVVIGDKAWWGRRAVVEVRERLIRFFFEEAGCSKIWGTPNARNYPAVFNYNRLGFTQEGIMRQHMRGMRDEALSDLIVFGMLRSEWLARERGRAP